ncbi:MAG: acetate--CoA ligase family protein, partial [Pseudomonadota bacterium]
RAATVSHTASLAGSDAGARALLVRLGIGQVRSLAAMLETLKLLHVVGPLNSNRIASMSCSGGEASLMADATVGTGLVYPALSARQSSDLRTALGPKVALANPLDYHTYIWDDVPAMTETFSALMQGDLAIGCIVVDFPREDRCNPEAWECVISAAAAAQKASGKMVALLGSLSDAMPEPVALRVLQRGLLPLCGMSEAIEAMDVAAQIGSVAAAPAPLLLPKPDHAGTKTLTEAEAKSTLAHYGLRIPQSAQAKRADEAGQIAEEFGGAVVVKGQGVAHKTEAGAVVLNVRGAKAVEAAARGMPTETFLVEEMIKNTVAEVLVGVVKDPAHGYVMTLAAGGTLTELLEDSASLLVPSDAQAIGAALRSLKVTKLLNGYRGAPGANVEAIVHAVMAVQAYVVAEHPEEVEVNPLMCGPTEAVAADALIKIGAPE